MTHKTLIQPFQQVMEPVRTEAIYDPTKSAVEAVPSFDKKKALLVSPAQVT